MAEIAARTPASWMPRGVVDMSFGYMLARAVHVVAELGVADHLESGPKTAAELATLTRTDERSLERLLLTLEAFGVFSLEASRFSLNDVSEPLRSNAPHSAREFVLASHAEWQFGAWEGALQSIRTGVPALQAKHGATLFDYLGRHPDQQRLFDRSMKAHTAAMLPALVQSCSFPSATRVVDVGGGDGTFLVEVLRRNPGCTGIVFDTPEVIAGIERSTLPEDVADRIEFRAGSAFEGVPRECDVYCLKHVLHDWDDARARQLLETCVRDMPAAAQVLIIEAVLHPGERRPGQRLMDLGMLLTTGGRERSVGEFRKLCEASGLKLDRTLPNKSPYTILVATQPAAAPRRAER